MAAYNCEEYILEAIESILSQIDVGLELLILDDGSSDGTLALANSVDDARVRIWTGKNRGKSAALNFLLERAKGEFSTLMDADDVSAPDRLAVTVGHLVAHPNLAAVLSGHWLRMNGRTVCPRAEWKSSARCRAEVLRFMSPAHDPTVVFRTAVGRSLKFSHYRLGGGVDFVFRLAEGHDVEVVGVPLYTYRLRSDSATTAPIESRERQLLEVFNAACARRSLPPLSYGEFKLLRGPAATDPLNDLLGHFTDSCYLQLQERDRRGALTTAWDALRLLPFRLQNLRPMIYAASPRWLARIIRAKRSRQRAQVLEARQLASPRAAPTPCRNETSG